MKLADIDVAAVRARHGYAVHGYETCLCMTMLLYIYIHYSFIYCY